MPDARQTLQTIGRAAATAGVFVGRKIAQGYNSIDPDVVRHLAQVPLLSYSLFISRRDPIEAGEPDGHPPLIFVHGLGGNRGNFWPMALFMRFSGRKRSYKIHFDGSQSFDDMAAALARFVRDVQEATGESTVEVVAHSMGGLIARLAIVDYDLGDAVRTLITLGTPHKGTFPARFANTDHTRLLRPESELIRHLEAHPLPAHIRTVCFWSKNDLLVLPAESGVLDGAEAVELTPFTHYSYLLDPKGWSSVAHALQQV